MLAGALVVAVVIVSIVILVRVGLPRAGGAGSHPTSPPPTAAARPPSARGEPPSTLQGLIDQATPGATVHVPPGIYREQVTIDKPLTLSGEGVEIRGSDPWTAWTAAASSWVSTASVPEFETGGYCVQPGCERPEQVYFDGAPLRRAEASPGPGQFGLDAERHVVLGQDPAGHVVEVTVRPSWMHVTASDVTVAGFTMRDAATAAQFGGLEADGADRLQLRDVTLEGSHGVDLGIRGGSGQRISDIEARGAGQLGIRIEDAADVQIERAHIVGNNTAGFNAGWEAGGLKALGATGFQVRDSLVEGNAGYGLWCDGACHDFRASGNRVHDNSHSGIFFEISRGATITANQVWSNGWGMPTWAWGGGIVVGSASDALVQGNVVAWNADGITVLSQDRGGEWNLVSGDRIEDNVVAIEAGDGGDPPIMLGWLQDGGQGAMFDAQAGNGSAGNRLWADRPEPADCRFRWRTCLATLEALQQAGVDRDSRNVTQDELAAALAAAGVPVTPETAVHP
jgi:parallel beta-helix repeat protein